MYGPVLRVRDDTGNIRGHLFGSQAMRWGCVSNVKTERKEDALVERMQGWLRGGIKVCKARSRGSCGGRGEFGLLEQCVVVQG